MPQPTDNLNQRPPGFLVALWFSFTAFLRNLFSRSPSTAALPNPVTTRSPKVKPNVVPARTTSAPARVTHQRISIPYVAWVKEQTPLKHSTSAVSTPISSTARTTPACRSRSTTPIRTLTYPEHILHPPASPFPNISLSGIFATPPLSASPCLASEVELGSLSFASPPKIQTLTPVVSPGSPSPFRASHGPTTPSFHTVHSRSPCPSRTPSSAVIVQLDRSTFSPTTMSDGSLEVISLGDRRGFVGSPVKVAVADIGRLPSPWSPTGRMTSSDVWLAVDGVLVNATGPVDDYLGRSQDDSAAPRTVTVSSLTGSRISASSLYSSSSAFSALGILVNLDGMGDHLISEGNNVHTRDDTSNVPKLNEVRGGNRPTFVAQDTQTPRKRRETLPSVTRSGAASHGSRATRCLSTPLTKLDNADISQVRSDSSISSMTYELRLGLFAEGKSMTAIENIISMLDQASPESIPPHDDLMPVVGTV